MLERLVEYSARQRLVSVGFTPKIVKWAIALDDSGRFLGIEELGDVDNPRNSGREFPACPDLSHSELVGGKERRSHFLLETVATVLGSGTSKDALSSKKRTYFLRLLRQASGVCPETALFADVLEDEALRGEMIRWLASEKARPNDKITVMFCGREPPFLLEDSCWHAWWSEYRKSLSRPGRARSGRPMVSFISGEAVAPARTHPKITELGDVGAGKSGATMVSCDKDALCSYGLAQSLNSAMSEEEAAAYRAGLNHLLANHGHRVASTKIGYAYHDPIAEEDNPMRMILDPTGGRCERDGESKSGQEVTGVQSAAIAEAERLMEAIESGKRRELKRNRYFSLTLSGFSGRVVVRDWTEGRFDELLNNSLAWFADLAIVSPDGESIAPPPKLGAILAALARSPREVPAPLAAALWRAATRRQPIPREALARAVERFRAEVVAEKRPNRARAGLMKAALLRNRIAVGEYLNEYHASAAYHCGRLVAVAAEAHAASLGPSFGPRAARAYYLIAHVDPGRALPMLLADLGFHRDRLFGTPSGALLSAETRAILDEIRGRGGAPEFLLLEDRCLFSLGFYQQRASLIRRASDSPAEPDPEKRPQPYTKTEPDSEPAADTSPSA